METRKQYLNERQVASMTGIAVQTLRNKRCSGKGFPYSKGGRRILYDDQEIISYIESRKIPSID